DAADTNSLACWV
ncbi:hypothetical protein D030_1490B, partial [Vibrio parahaemolyticus AQ3810]